MQISVKGKQLDVGDALRQHVETTLTEKIGKYFSDAVDAQVILQKDAYLYCAEIIVHPGKHGMVVQASANANEPYPAFDEAADKIAKRLRRYKSRMKDHAGTPHDERPEAQNVRKLILNPEQEESAEAADHPPVIAELTTPIMTLTVSEAVMNLELGDMPALLFINKAHGGYNMLYRRADGNIGWVDPTVTIK